MLLRQSLLATVAFSLLGCTTQMQRIGVDNGTDACRQYLVALDATGNYFGESVAIGAGIGAAIGAGIGYLSTGNAKGAAAGAGAGAVAGGTVGYAQAQQQQQRDKQVLYQNALSDYEQKLAKIDEAQLAFKKLEDCRHGTLRQIASDYRAHRLDRSQATIQWHAVLALKARDLQIATNMGKDMSQLVAKMDQDGAAAGLPEARPRPVRVYTAPVYNPSPPIYSTNSPPPKSQQDSIAIQRAKAQIPMTTTAQTHLQSYNNTVAVAQAGYNSQLATADNPDGFETSLKGG